MKIERIAASFHTSYHRSERGSFEAAYRLTLDDGTTGLAFYVYEWDKRDVMTELLETEPQIARAARALLCGDDGHEGPIPLDLSPSALSDFQVAKSHGDPAVLENASLAATERVFGS